jgi:hypothetical protein
MNSALRAWLKRKLKYSRKMTRQERADYLTYLVKGKPYETRIGNTPQPNIAR